MLIDMLILAAGSERTAPHRGTRVQWTEEQIVAFVRSPMVSESKSNLGGFSLGDFRYGVRQLSHFGGTSAIGLDYDDGACSPRDLSFMLCTERRHVVYTTHSSTPTHPRCRAILFLDRVVTRSEHGEIIRFLYARAASRGISLDPHARDASRWWYAPCVHPDRQAEFAIISSAPDSLPYRADTLLSAARRAFPPESRPIATPPADLNGSPRARAAAYVERMDPAISGSGGHLALWAVARKLVKDFALSDDDAWPILLDYSARCQPPWSERELKHKLTQARSATVCALIRERPKPRRH